MQLFNAFKSFLPEVHAFNDEEHRFNIGATWTASDGLKDFYNLELRFIHNSERLALQGLPRPDGSWSYTESSGRVHTITAERAKAFMDQTHRQATIMVGMLDRLRDSGVMSEPVEATAQPG